MARALSLGSNHAIEIATPFVRHAQGGRDPARRVSSACRWTLTLSCMNPVDAPMPLHCGQCSKCRERRDAFAAAGVADPTAYAHAEPAVTQRAHHRVRAGHGRA